jgi:hypothetical protein
LRLWRMMWFGSCLSPKGLCVGALYLGWQYWEAMKPLRDGAQWIIWRQWKCCHKSHSLVHPDLSASCFEMQSLPLHAPLHLPGAFHRAWTLLFVLSASKTVS